MGGSGGGAFSWPDRNELAELKKKAEKAASDSTFGAELSQELSQLLSKYNERDTELVTQRVNQIKTLIEKDVEGSVDTLFGGSVAKHTYVDGLSDIDTLLVLNESELAEKSPRGALNRLRSILEEKLATSATITQGDLAITVTYSDGMEIQCLPAMRTATGLKIGSGRRNNQWSEINPEAFTDALTTVNKSSGSKLIPTIKLAKAINAGLPGEVQLSGYHIEAIAASAFASYQDELTPARMLPVFFERGAEIVLAPIRDRTGQSIHVDGYLGDAGSPQRQQVSHVFTRIAKRMRNATVGRNLDQWKAMFD